MAGRDAREIRALAERFAGAGFLVLDGQAVLGAPAELYLPLAEGPDDEHARNPRRQRQPWDRFALQALAALTLILVLGSLLCGRFRLGIDDQQALCLPPYRWYLIDTWARQPEVGQLVAFAATEAMAPYFRVGQTVIKRVVGVAGDRIAVDAEGTANQRLPVGQQRSGACGNAEAADRCLCA